MTQKLFIGTSTDTLGETFTQAGQPRSVWGLWTSA